VTGRITFREGDITLERVDAIVNAANSALRLGSGVAGAILERGGSAIQAACDAIGAIAVGDAVATTGGALAAPHVIHAASMEPGGDASEDSIRSALRRSLEVARELGCRSVAVPAIGAGAAGVPLQRCAEVLLEEARRHLDGDTSIEEIRFVLLGEPAYRVFESVDDAIRIALQAKRWSGA
jgi:O-acetyl-ADP-ribose deacetylase (regulator of RNase III)